ncbi:YhcN/YlaJ family sporulation lipoprotein [Clostridiaceae bacterium 35-E11]
MNRRKKMFLWITMCMMLVFFVAMGCTPARRPIPERDRVDVNDERIDDMQLRNDDLNDINMGHTAPSRRPIVDDLEQGDLGYGNIPNEFANNLTVEREIEGMTGVRDAVVILYNNTAYVGIEEEGDVATENMKTMQAEIARIVRSRLNEIERVYVTSDMNRVEKLRNYAVQINKGRPVRQFINDIQNLFR